MDETDRSSHSNRVVCAIILHEKKVLVVKRPKGKEGELKWEFPGGKVHVLETDEVALSRELLEELSVIVEIKDALPEVLHYGILLAPYLVSKPECTIRLMKHTDYMWCDIDELYDLDMPDINIKIIPSLERELYLL